MRIHNGCSETGQGVEQDGLVAAVVRAEQKSRYRHAGIKVDEIQAMTKEKLACPVWTSNTVVKIERRRGGKRGECGSRLRCHESHHRST
jgi:hypothetical protein